MDVRRSSLLVSKQKKPTKAKITASPPHFWCQHRQLKRPRWAPDIRKHEQSVQKLQMEISRLCCGFLDHLTPAF